MRGKAEQRNRPRTLSIGGATYDLFVRTGAGVLEQNTNGNILALPLGQKIRVEEVIETCGGGAANTSVGLARLGCEAHFCGILGSDQWGQHLLENFRREKVNPDGATIVEGETSSFSIILSAGSGERVILYEPGTNAHLHDANFDRAQAATMDWIYFNHIHEHSRIIEDDIIAIIRNNPSIGLTWNPGGDQLRNGIGDEGNRALLAVTRLFICNKEEARQFTGKEHMNETVTALLQAGVAVVCICDGKNGSVAADAKTRVHCPVIADTKVVETTGAGDAFGTGMTWGLMTGLDLRSSLKAGTINASGVIGAIGAEAGLLTDIEIRHRLETCSLDVREIAP